MIHKYIINTKLATEPATIASLSPQALWPAVRSTYGRDSGELEFYYRWISTVKQFKPFTEQPINHFRILHAEAFRGLPTSDFPLPTSDF